MRTLAKMTWLELKLFAREPVTVVFTLAFPLLVLFVMGEVFGNTPDPDGKTFRGVGPMEYYVPAYIGLVMASIGLIGLPVHLAGYRELGVLRRLRASGVPLWVVLGAQVMVSLVLAIAGAVLLTAMALVMKDVHLPRLFGLFIPAFLLSATCFASIGVFLGSLMPTARAAQGAGLVLFFVMMMIGGAGPPPEVMTDVLNDIAAVTSLKYVRLTLQEPWLGFGWNGTASAVVAGFMLATAGLSARFFRWE
jgi:ABC-2 type transport system permease protein